MIKFGVSNLRRLKDVPPLELRPITVLVGRNSSGKSTYLRSLPLLRQSINTRTSAPILWYGDLVDFGSYETTVTENAINNTISFTFSSDTLESRRTWQFPENDENRIDFKGVTYAISIVPEGFQTRIKCLKLEFQEPGLSYHIELGSDGKIGSINVNGNDIRKEISEFALVLTPGSVFPELHVARRTSGPDRFYFPPRDDFLIDAVVIFLKQNFSSRVSDENIANMAYRLVQMGPSTKNILERGRIKTGSQQLNRFLEVLSSKDKVTMRRDFGNVLAASWFPELLNRTTAMFRAMVSNMLYIGPARARSERYYRYQELAVSEIDPDGKNFPMFLNSLSGSQLRQLSRWIENLFGYGLTLSRSGGHISINLDEKGAASNLVDVGYGVSQILPVLAQIWWARERERPLWMGKNTIPTFLAIEQPELHLHPAHQALLADALVGEAALRGSSSRPNKVHFLVESHSETFINRLGQLVSQGKIKPESVNIVVFSPDDEEERITKVQVATFNEDGSLENWPYGFFQATVD
ncbi:DUF3696 domain-containing protein [Methylocystis bryophila]|nr:DUF3696 domain-containing protein [Methylocystis bryophila]